MVVTSYAITRAPSTAVNVRSSVSTLKLSPGSSEIDLAAGLAFQPRSSESITLSARRQSASFLAAWNRQGVQGLSDSSGLYCPSRTLGEVEL